MRGCGRICRRRPEREEIKAAAQGGLRAAPRERDPQGRVGVFRDRARRRPTEVSRFIDEHRGRFGVEPICRVLGVSASAYYQRASGQRSRARGRGRAAARRGSRELHAANYYAYGYRRMWKALLRAGEQVGRDPRQAADAQRTASRAPSAAASRGAPPGPTRGAPPPPISSSATSPPTRPGRAVGRRLHLPALLGGPGVLRLRHRRLQPPRRRLAARRRTCAPTLVLDALRMALGRARRRRRRADPPLRPGQPGRIQLVVATPRSMEVLRWAGRQGG